VVKKDKCEEIQKSIILVWTQAYMRTEGRVHIHGVLAFRSFFFRAVSAIHWRTFVVHIVELWCKGKKKQASQKFTLAEATTFQASRTPSHPPAMLFQPSTYRDVFYTLAGRSLREGR
jgi:hypothetical protein